MSSIREQNENEINDLKAKKKEIETETEKISEEKEKQINDYRKNIEGMQADFAKMLGETLSKIKNKINEANKSWEDEHDSKMLKGYEDIANRAGAGQWEREFKIT